MKVAKAALQLLTPNGRQGNICMSLFLHFLTMSLSLLLLFTVFFQLACNDQSLYCCLNLAPEVFHLVYSTNRFGLVFIQLGWFSWCELASLAQLVAGLGFFIYHCKSYLYKLQKFSLKIAKTYLSIVFVHIEREQCICPNCW